jgi:predicted DsbA family dithiol-disulfide isomerase
MQQAVLQAYFWAHFHEGKDIGNIDLLGEIAHGAGLMSNAEVCDRLKFPSIVDADSDG